MKVAKGASLNGWQKIAEYLGQPVATAQRWAKSGMPVSRQGRYVTASPDELSRWLGRETGSRGPVHIPAAGEQDLVADLKRGLKETKRHKRTA